MHSTIHPTTGRKRGRRPHVLRLVILAAVSGVAACGLWKPGTPGHEPPSAGRYNPVSGEENAGNR